MMRPLQFCVYFLSYYFPRDPHRWVFGSWHGNLFVDNTAALFLYCARLSDDTVRPIWITKGESDGTEIRTKRCTKGRT